jgi:hypothetical protein
MECAYSYEQFSYGGYSIHYPHGVFFMGDGYACNRI